MVPRLDWTSWFVVSLPVSFLSIFLIWVLLLLSYRPERSPDGEGFLEIKAIRPTKEGFTGRQWWVTGVCVVTIGGWCVEGVIEEWVGDMGVVAIVPIVAFFGTGVLKKVSFWVGGCFFDLITYCFLGRF
jgi:phosphate transporter